MIVSTIVLLHMVVSAGNGQPCTKDVQCTSGSCQNWSGGSLTCCEPIGTACTGSSDQYCCNNGNSSVACNQDPNNNSQYICGSPSGGYCASAADCAQYYNGAYSGGGSPWYEFKCLAIEGIIDAGPGWNTFEADAGSLPWFDYLPSPDAGPNFFLAIPPACSICVDDGFIAPPANDYWGGYGVNDYAQACAFCCTDNCLGWVDGGGIIDAGPPTYAYGNVICCSGNHQTCLGDSDCCNQGNLSLKCDLNTACNKDAGQCNDGGSIGKCCLVDGQHCGIGSDCCSGVCDADAGTCGGSC